MAIADRPVPTQPEFGLSTGHLFDEQWLFRMQYQQPVVRLVHLQPYLIVGKFDESQAVQLAGRMLGFDLDLPQRDANERRVTQNSSERRTVKTSVDEHSGRCRQWAKRMCADRKCCVHDGVEAGVVDVDGLSQPL